MFRIVFIKPKLVDNADIDIRVCTQTSVHAGLAVWADPNDALEFTVFSPGIGPAETLGVDGGGAPAAALVISAEDIGGLPGAPDTRGHAHWRSEEHTSELQSR